MIPNSIINNKTGKCGDVLKSLKILSRLIKMYWLTMELIIVGQIETWRYQTGVEESGMVDFHSIDSGPISVLKYDLLETRQYANTNTVMGSQNRFLLSSLPCHFIRNKLRKLKKINQLKHYRSSSPFQLLGLIACFGNLTSSEWSEIIISSSGNISKHLFR